MISRTTLSRLKEIVGHNNFLDSEEDRITYSYDATPLLAQLPIAVLRPPSVDELSQILKLANEDHFAIVPRGSGTGLSGGSIPTDASVVVLTNHWNRILEVDTDNFLALVEPGVITSTLHTAVEAKKLLYPPDPGSSTICTIGGNVAENAGGLRGLKYGVTKNYVQGIEVVLPTGDVIQAGSKAVKDVAGYNLTDYFVGSEGTLGIFSKVLLRLVPKPETSKTILACFDKLANSSETVTAIIMSRITPSMLEFLDRTTINCVEQYARVGLPTTIESLLLIEIDGRKAIVEEDAAKIVEICKKNNATVVRVAQSVEESNHLKTARKVAFSALARIRPTTILEDATVPRNELPKMLESINSIARKYDLTFGNFGHAGDGNLHPTCLTDERNSDEIYRTKQAFDEIFTEAVKLGGTITGEHGTGLSKKRFFESITPPPALAMMRAIKSVMDPQGILNPGKIFDMKPRCEGSLPRHKDHIKKFTDRGAFL